MRLVFNLLVLLLVHSSLGYAESNLPAKKIASEIYQEFLSPFCPGRALSDCPSSKAEDLKDQILSELEQGQSKDIVLRNLETQFGAEYNAKPKLSGFAGLAWLVPIVFMGLILLIGYSWIKGNSNKIP